MVFVFVGIAFMVLKITEYGPVALWSWWWVLLPFLLAALWWEFSDGTGLTRARAMRKMDERKVARRERDMEALGLNTRRDKRTKAVREAAKRAAAATPPPGPPR